MGVGARPWAFRRFYICQDELVLLRRTPESKWEPFFSPPSWRSQPNVGVSSDAALWYFTVSTSASPGKPWLCCIVCENHYVAKAASSAVVQYSGELYCYVVAYSEICAQCGCSAVPPPLAPHSPRYRAMGYQQSPALAQLME
jgi:hypothetical protein